MRHALVERGAVKAYPYTLSQLKRDNPDVSFPADARLIRIEEFGVVEVEEVSRPEPSSLSVDVVEGEPVLVDKAWRQTWKEVPADAETVAAREKEAAVRAELDAAKLDAWIVQYLALTPDEAQAFIMNNSATLAALRTNVGRLAYAVRVLIRRELGQ